MTGTLARLVAQDLDQPVGEAARMVVRAVVAAHGSSVAAILFYGSCLRGGAGGILDFYVLTTSLRRYFGGWPQAALCALLPPTVSYVEIGPVAAKIAVMDLSEFERRASGNGLDATVWARFCQPTALVYVRDEQTRGRIRRAMAGAVARAAWWAARLGPQEGTPRDYWISLFRATYGAELRAEASTRGGLLYRWAAARYDALLHPALGLSGTAAEVLADGRLRPKLSCEERRRAARAWAWRRWAGKFLNAIRLVKAAFTFTNGGRYILWKIERHGGRRLDLSAWQRRHPLLAAPRLLWRFYRR